MTPRTAGLLALAVFALALRVGLVAVLWTDHDRPLGYEHGRIAENLLAGGGFSIEFLGSEGPTSQQAPFYPLLLAGAYWLFGVGSADAVLAVQLLQCTAGTGLVLAVVWLARSLVPRAPAVGWVAGLGAAVYPTHLYSVTHMQVALWAALWLTLLLGVVVSPRWRGTTAGAVLGGLLSGVLLLTEPILALALPFCAIAFWLGGPVGQRVPRATCPPARAARAREDKPPVAPAPWRRMFHPVALMAAVAAVVIAPWIARNWRVHGELVFVKSTFGYAFWQGNNPASHGTDKIPKPSADAIRRDHDGTLAGMDRALHEARHETLYIDDVLLKPHGYAELAGLTEPERSRLLGRRAVRFVRENPGRYAALSWQRLRYFLLFDETNPKAANRIYRAATAVWFVLAAVGLLATLGRWRRFWPTWAVFFAVTLFHALVITSVRFRVPIEPMSFVWIAAAVTPAAGRVLHGLGTRRRGSAPSCPSPDALPLRYDEVPPPFPPARRAA